MNVFATATKHAKLLSMSKDAYSHPHLTDRQLKILGALIRTYIQDAQPVSSKQLVDDHDLKVSSATVRNEVVMLEQLGMVRAPHTSAGRIPTEEGYRYFVQQLLEENSLSIPEQERIREEFAAVARDIQKWMKTAAAILVRATNATAVVTEPRALTPRFKHLQLIGMHGQVVLLVLVLEGGELSQQMLTLSQEADQERLSQVAAMINDVAAGENAAGVRHKTAMLHDDLAQDTLELVAEVMSEAENAERFAIHWYGFGDVLDKFNEGDSAQQALHILDEKPLLYNILSEAWHDPSDEVKVLVGGEGRFEEISDLSIVIGRYGTRHIGGAISVLGPTRMRYGRAISTVRYVSTVMSAMMQDVYGTRDE